MADNDTSDPMDWFHGLYGRVFHGHGGHPGKPTPIAAKDEDENMMGGPPMAAAPPPPAPKDLLGNLGITEEQLEAARQEQLWRMPTWEHNLGVNRPVDPTIDPRYRFMVPEVSPQSAGEFSKPMWNYPNQQDI